MKRIVNDIFPGWDCEGNYEFSELGKIWLVWSKSVRVIILFKTAQMITCEFLLPDSTQRSIFTVVYASNEETERRVLWTDLVSLSHSQAVRGKPWLVLGDFNQIIKPEEHSRADTMNTNLSMRLFRDCLLKAELTDMKYRGNLYTWWNKSLSLPIAKKLDRVMMNKEWQSSFPDSYAVFGEQSFSDHVSMCVVMHQEHLSRKKPFKFFNMLLNHQDFLPKLATFWFSIQASGSPMLRLAKKLKAIKPMIKEFSRRNYSGIESRVKEALDDLLSAQQANLASPNAASATRELNARRKWLNLSKAEESYFKQKSRIGWLKEGDGNTRYFHSYANARRATNHIHSLTDADGTTFDTQEGILSQCVSYYKKLLGSDQGSEGIVQADMDNLITYRCSNAEREKLGSQFTDVEIKEALFSMPSNKTPGPDGFTSEFFKSCWELIGTDVTEAIRDFFHSKTLLKQWNSTNMIMIPKKINASSAGDFRPIACLNTVYKVISRLLSSRLKLTLSSAISEEQSAFLPGRSLSENVLLATELVQGYNRSSVSPRGMLKVDLRKAFDTLRWDFVLKALRALRLPEIFVDWIYECISTPTFSVSVNGEMGGFFESSQGLRQGDPLSPYLFVLAMEAFSNLVKSRYKSGSIKFHPRTSTLQISHLMFADDLMLFFDGGFTSLHGINEMLADFASWSGLETSVEKTQLFLAGVTPEETARMALMQYPIASLPIRYLGLPLMSRRLRLADYDILLDKLTSRMRSWGSKILSFAGRLQLVKSVIYGNINFWMSTFILPKGCIRKMEGLCARFIWSGNVEIKKIAKVSWNSICLPRDEGGLGLRRLSTWNRVLCLRLIWQLHTANYSLWAKWIRFEYLRRENFWEAKVAPKFSWNWNSILKLRPLALNFLRCRVGKGDKALFWFDVWTSLGQLLRFFGENGPAELQVSRRSLVSQAVVDQTWRLPHPRSERALELHQFLTTLKPPAETDPEDVFEWIINDEVCNGFSVYKTWDAIRERGAVLEWTKHIWYKGAIPKLAFQMWVTHLDRLPTRERLAAKGIVLQTENCLFCSSAVESRDHVMLGCHFARAIWRRIFSRLTPANNDFSTWEDLSSWMKGSSNQGPAILRKLVAQATVFQIWKQRNNSLHNGQSLSSDVVFNMLDREVRNVISARRKSRNFSKLMERWIR